MIKNMKRFKNVKNECAVKDPHELLLSLVDMGSLDVEDALLACVKEMSDAECKRVLGSLSLPACCDEVEEPEEDMDMEDVEPDDAELDDEDTDIEPVEPAELDDDIEDMDDEEIAEVEARIRKLERVAAMNQTSDEDEEDKEDDEEMNERCCEARIRHLENLLRRRMLNRRFR